MTKERASKIILDLINAGEAEYRNFSVEEIMAFKKGYVALNSEPTTNADRIRAMSDEELATWVDHIQTDAYERGMMETPIVDYPNIYSGWLDWLKEEDGE